MYWDWNKTKSGMLRLGIMLLAFSFIFQNLTLFNRLFLAQLPVGSIFFFIIGILILLHICKTLKWYIIWLKSRRNIKSSINVIIHFCLYLIVISLVLSIPMSLDRLTVPNNAIIIPNNTTKYFNETVRDIESINGSNAGQNNTYKIPALLSRHLLLK